MKYYFVVGEPSGDLHASNLAEALKKTDPDARFSGTGGDLMQQQGVKIDLHYREMAFMGFIEVIANLRKIFKNMNLCKSSILRFKPDVLILVDYPGFNMRLASWAKTKGIAVVYYISPQVWAWKQGRVHKLKRTVDRMLTILPFEQEFYAKFGMETDFVGHPLLDALEKRTFTSREKFFTKNQLPAQPVIALLPGSRNQEISRMLPVMSSIRDKFPGYTFIIAGAPGQQQDIYNQHAPGLPVFFGKTYELLHHAEAALVTSGTATLETALIGTPEVVCYKAGNISYQIARRVIKVPFISLVNLVMEREVVKELIQQEMNAESLEVELKKLLSPTMKEKMKEDYDLLQSKLGGTGASERAARIIYSVAQA